MEEVKREVKDIKLQCPLCDEEFNPEEDGNYGYTLDENTACGACFEHASESPSRAWKFNPDGTQDEYIFDEHFDLLGNGLPEAVKGEKYVSSGGWSGYTDWDLNPGYIELAGGWVTGYIDDTVSHKKELADYFEKIKEGSLIPPVPILWLFGHTSNVFSTSSAIVIKESDKEAVEKWLLEIDGGVDHFKEMLS